MSLKAKIEAVIYASEEPVTLAQLTGLLGHEAQAELDRLDAAQHSLDLEAAQDEAPANEDDLNSEVLAESEPSTEPGSEPAEATEAAPTPQAAEQGSEAALSDEKKQARESKEEKEKARRLREYFRTILDELFRDYATSERGLEIREVAGGYRLATKPEYHDAVRGFVKSLKPPLKLSLQALETLAVVAYKQPVTAPEISEIRGVDSGGVLGSLMTRKLITTAGRKQVIGRPILYKTTKDFLLRFGLKDISELPSIEEFEKMAGELAEQEEIPMQHHEAEASGEETHPHHAPESSSDLEPERHTHAPQADGSPDTEDNPLDDPIDESPTPLDPIDLPENSEIAENIADQVIVDGRISGLPPHYDDEQPSAGVDSPALDAEIQSDLSKDSQQD
jgi:segregation and condensation protein B